MTLNPGLQKESPEASTRNASTDPARPPILPCLERAQQHTTAGGGALSRTQERNAQYTNKRNTQAHTGAKHAGASRRFFPVCFTPDCFAPECARTKGGWRREGNTSLVLEIRVDLDPKADSTLRALTHPPTRHASCMTAVRAEMLHTHTRPLPHSLSHARPPAPTRSAVRSAD